MFPLAIGKIEKNLPKWWFKIDQTWKFRSFSWWNCEMFTRYGSNPRKSAEFIFERFFPCYFIKKYARFMGLLRGSAGAHIYPKFGLGLSCLPNFVWRKYKITKLLQGISFAQYKPITLFAIWMLCCHDIFT